MYPTWEVCSSLVKCLHEIPDKQLTATVQIYGARGGSVYYTIAHAQRHYTPYMCSQYHTPIIM